MLVVWGIGLIALLSWLSGFTPEYYMKAWDNEKKARQWHQMLESNPDLKRHWDDNQGRGR
jgi:hypothetical protein